MAKQKTKSIQKLSELVQIIFNQDLIGFMRFYDDNVSIAYTLAFQLLQDSDAARQLVVKVFQRVWKSPPSENLKVSASTWLINTTRRDAINLIRSENYQRPKGRIKKPISSQFLGPEIHNENVDHMREAMTSLSENEKIVLDELYFNGFSLYEVTNRNTKNSQDEIITFFHSAMKKLRTHLGYDKA